MTEQFGQTQRNGHVPEPPASPTPDAGEAGVEPPPPKNRLVTALIAYAVLIAIACGVLHGKMLAGVLIMFAGLIAKTVIAIMAGWRAPE